MTPQITAWEDLIFNAETVDPETGAYQHTTFGVVDEDDTAYFGKLYTPKSSIAFSQLTSALVPIPDEDIFPEWALHSAKLTQAQETLPPDHFIKRPSLSLYDVFQEHNVLRLIPKGLLEEAEAMEMMSKHPHPNIVKYHGCRVRRGRITGLVLDWHANTLFDYVTNNIESLDKERFMQALESAIHHLHSLGWAHNDLQPHNIMVSEGGMPVLIDFGSAREVGAKLGTSRGTQAWIDKQMKDYHTSDKSHDISALEKVRKWLDAPTFDD